VHDGTHDEKNMPRGAMGIWLLASFWTDKLLVETLPMFEAKISVAR